MIVIFSLTLVAQGCGVNVPKYLVYDALQEKRAVFTRNVERDSPAYFYCFNKGREKLREEMTYFYDQCLETKFMDLPPDIQDVDHEKLGEEIGLCRLISYCEYNKNYFSLESLTPKQKEECKTLKRNMIDTLQNSSGSDKTKETVFIHELVMERNQRFPEALELPKTVEFSLLFS